MANCQRCGAETSGLTPLPVLKDNVARWGCDRCYLELTGNFFAPGAVRDVKTCLLGHPVPHEDSLRCGWVCCPTCLASAPRMDKISTLSPDDPRVRPTDRPAPDPDSEPATAQQLHLF